MQITTIEKEVSPIVIEAQALIITSKADMTGATTLLSRLNKMLDNATEEKERVTAPLNQALKAERSRWKPLETTLETAINLIRTKMSTYHTEALLEQRRAEEAIAKRVEKGTLKIDTAMTKLSKLDTPEAKVQTEDGSVRFRTVYSVKIKDDNKIPRMYLIPDEKIILEDLKAGKKVAGCELVETQSVINSR